MYILFSKFDKQKQHTILILNHYETLISKFHNYKIINNIDTNVQLINFQNDEYDNISFSSYNIDKNIYYKYLPNQKLNHLYVLEINDHSSFHKITDIHYSSNIDDLLKIPEKIFSKKDNINIDNIKKKLIQNNYILNIIDNCSYQHNCDMFLYYFTL